jgi:DNA-binding IclR family transcriptional regulator
VIAALGMSVPAATVSIAEIHHEYLPAVVKAADAISSRLGYNTNGSAQLHD